MLFFKGQHSLMLSRTTLPTMRALLIPSWLMLKQWMHNWIDLMLVLIVMQPGVNCSAFHYLFFHGSISHKSMLVDFVQVQCHIDFA